MVVAGHVKTGLNIKEMIVSPFLRISENCLLKQSANLFPMIESYIVKKFFSAQISIMPAAMWEFVLYLSGKMSLLPQLLAKGFSQGIFMGLKSSPLFLGFFFFFLSGKCMLDFLKCFFCTYLFIYLFFFPIWNQSIVPCSVLFFFF